VQDPEQVLVPALVPGRVPVEQDPEQVPVPGLVLGQPAVPAAGQPEFPERYWSE
jgi:hypothetical protein